MYQIQDAIAPNSTFTGSPWAIQISNRLKKHLRNKALRNSRYISRGSTTKQRTSVTAVRNVTGTKTARMPAVPRTDLSAPRSGATK